VQATAAPGLEELLGQLERPLKIARGAGDTHNSLVFFGHRLVLKLFRKLEGGLNPDIEVTRHLAEKTPFRRVPRVLGTLNYQPPQGEPIALAALQELLPQESSGWDHALEEVRRYLEWAKSQAHLAAPFAPDGRSLLQRAAAEPSPAIREAIGAYLSAAATLGQRTAELHLGLAEAAGDPDFAPEPLLRGDLAILARGLWQQVRAALRELQQNLDRLPEELREPARRLLRARQALLGQVSSLASQPLDACKIRCHGDYHLGQVLRRENDFHILDFEGDPARPLVERRRKGCPLADVAGMLRSFSRDAYAGLLAASQDRPDDFAPLEPWVSAWCEGTAAEFLRHYLQTAGDAVFLPKDRDQLGRWLQAFGLEKSCGELVYELGHRPDWVRIPLTAILGPWGAEQGSAAVVSDGAAGGG
jgi:maltose alpha-D-glucosyltransferase/alpha-amylase